MRYFTVLAAAFLAAASGGNVSQADGNESTVAGPYLGQQPPGVTPEVFAPGLVSTNGWEYGGTFSPDMQEFYFLAQNEKYSDSSFILFKREGETWQETRISARKGQPFIAPNGKTLHLGRRYMERTDAGWSDVKQLDAPFSDILIMRMTASANGTYYFDTYDKDNESAPIRYSRVIDGKYETPKPLSAEINTGTYLSHPFIAPDESYILWDAKRDEGQGNSDIYVSFRKQDGAWGKAINLGDAINTDAWEASASVTPDGKYLFFSRNVGSDSYENVDIFWVDAQVLYDLRPAE